MMRDTDDPIIFSSELARLINGEFSSKWHRLASELFPHYVFKQAAKKLSRKAQGLPELAQPLKGDKNKAITFPAAEVQLSSVMELKRWVKKHLSNDIVALILHGSLGSNEPVPYSDFDGLVIIKNEVIRDTNRLSKAALLLFKARRFMYQQDALQHHGWFVMHENDVNNWPKHYLPFEALMHASQISHDTPISIEFTEAALNPPPPSPELLTVINNLSANLNGGLAFENMYRFKGFISKILLLPALYIQHFEGRGIYKRDSFLEAQSLFTYENWQAIEAATIVRENWKQQQTVYPKLLSTRPGIIGDYLRRNYSGSVPLDLANLFGESEMSSLRGLIETINGQLNEKE